MRIADCRWQSSRSSLKSAVRIPRSAISNRFFDSAPSFFASPSRHGGISYDPLRREHAPRALNAFSQLILRELVGLRRNYDSRLRIGCKPLVKLQIQGSGFVTRI